MVKKKIKKGLSLLLTLSMVMSMINLAAFAKEEQEMIHTHNEGGWSCIQAEGAKTLTCESEEHTHTEECYRVITRRELVCELEETEAAEGHQHTEVCYDAEGGLSCTLEEAEAAEGHQHGEDCYESVEEKELTCEKEEHTHTEECYTITEGMWSCTAPAQVPEPAETLEPVQSMAARPMGLRAAIPEDSGDKDGDGLTVEVKAVEGSDPVRFDVTITGSGTVSTNTLVDDELGSSLGAYNGGGSRWHSVTVIGDITIDKGSPFSGSNTLESVTLTGPEGEGWLTINKYAFSDCPVLETVTLERVKCSSADDEPFSIYSKNDTVMTVTAKDCDLTGMFRDSNVKSAMITGGTIGEGAFHFSEGLADVTMSGVTEIGEMGFANCGVLEELSLPAVTKVGDSAFSGCTALKTVTLGGEDHDMTFTGTLAFKNCGALETLTLNRATVPQGAKLFDKTTGKNAANGVTVIFNGGNIEYQAFYQCSNLKTVKLNGMERVQGSAFYNCGNLHNVEVNGVTHLGYNAGYTDVSERMQAIMAGKFKLDPTPGIVDITGNIPEEGWDDPKLVDHKTAQSANWEGYDNGTQLVEQAKWINADKTKAQVKVDAYYTGEKQMDYIFVADLSGSMAYLGNAKDQNGKVYDMQSKLLDMTGQLLNAGDGYDCRVAIVTFGGNRTKPANGTCGSTTDASGKPAFLEDIAAVQEHINGLAPLIESTDYDLGMGTALELAKGNTDRNTVVVFLSDGAPNVRDGTQAAGEIKKLTNPDGSKVSIYGVLHSPGTGTAYTNAKTAMEKVCSEIPGTQTLFESTDTESFGQAMNEAFSAVYGAHTVIIPVNEAFKPVSGEDLEVSPSAGEATVSPDGKTITWTITGMPFTKHTLTYSMDLTDENAARTGEQEYPVNSGNGYWNDGGASVETPVLSRACYRLTVNYVYETEDGETAAPSVEQVLLEGRQYSVTSPTIEGYTTDRKLVEGTMPGEDVEETVVYRKTSTPPVDPPPGPSDPDPIYYTLTIFYQYEDGTTASDTVIQRRLERGDRYSVTSPVIEGYTADLPLVEGIMPGRNVEITVVYTAETVPVPTPTPDPAPEPGPAEPPEEDVEEPDTPLAEQPVGEPTEEPEEEPVEETEEELPEPDVPLADVPKTGDVLNLWLALAAVSGCGLAGLSLRKKEEEAE